MQLNIDESHITKALMVFNAVALLFICVLLYQSRPLQIDSAQAATEAITNLSKNLVQQRLIQISQATYSEQRLNALSERLDTTSNRLDGRMSILEARQRMQ